MRRQPMSEGLSGATSPLGFPEHVCSTWVPELGSDGEKSSPIVTLIAERKLLVHDPSRQSAILRVVVRSFLPMT